MNQNNSVRTASNQQHAAAATAAAGEEKPNANKLSSLPNGYLTKSRYISLLSNQTIRDNWPRLSSKSAPIIESILNQPFEFDKGTSIKKNRLFSSRFTFVFSFPKISINLSDKMASKNTRI